MTSYLLWVELVLLASILVAMAQCLVNLFIFRQRPVKAGAGDGNETGVSVLIPARNEENRIPACLESLFTQTSGILEILVLDDQSEDATASVVEDAARKDARIRLIRGQERPQGWVGKSWACLQLAKEAKGDFLLFTDADTVHHSASVAIGHAELLRAQADMLSFWPHQLTGTLPEKMLIPFMEILLLVFLPQWMPGRFSTLGAACGQFIIIRRHAYDQLDGHTSVHDHLVEDVALARTARGAGFRVVNRDGRHALHCRMYQSWKEIVEGFSKNLRASCDDSLLTFLGLHGFLHLLFLLPFLQLPFLFWMTPEMRLVVLLQIIAVYLLRVILAVARRHDWIGVILHPVAQILWLGITVNSWITTARGQVTWKGRQYGSGCRSNS